MGSFFMRTVNILIRLGGCPASSESSLGVQVILSALCGGSFGIVNFETIALSVLLRHKAFS